MTKEEALKKLKETRSEKDLASLAKEFNIDLTPELKAELEKLLSSENDLTLEDLDSVAGGRLIWPSL